MIAPTRQSHARSVAKALSWRILGAVATTVIVFVFTRRWGLSLLVGGVDFISKMGLLWLHERVWDRLWWGGEAARASVIWFTGLSGSGKSTISHRLTQVLRQRGLNVEHLDGDSVRAIFPNTGFTRPERNAHLGRVGFMASRMEAHGIFVVASFVSPYQESRDAVRAMCGSFIEVYVSTPLEECERRDTKGLYARARRGEIANFTGISDPYEPPTQAELVIDTTQITVDDAVRRVMALVRAPMATSTP